MMHAMMHTCHPGVSPLVAGVPFTVPFLVMLPLRTFLRRRNLRCRHKAETHHTGNKERPILHLAQTYHSNSLLLSGALFSGHYGSLSPLFSITKDARESDRLQKATCKQRTERIIANLGWLDFSRGRCFKNGFIILRLMSGRAFQDRPLNIGPSGII